MTLLERARRHLRDSTAVQAQFAEGNLEPLLAAATLIADAFQSQHKLLLCGNGGSAADCQHLAAEFVGRLTKDPPRLGLPALALTTDTSFITAHANDTAFDDIFRRQVEALGQAGDVLLGISTSGDSPNVMRAIDYGRAHGLRTIGLTGSVGKLSTLVEVSIAVPSAYGQYIQEAHLGIEHILCDLVEQLLRQ